LTRRQETKLKVLISLFSGEATFIHHVLPTNQQQYSTTQQR